MITVNVNTAHSYEYTVVALQTKLFLLQGDHYVLCMSVQVIYTVQWSSPQDQVLGLEVIFLVLQESCEN